MRRPSFSVVTLVVVTLSGVAFLDQWVRPLIPPPPSNKLEKLPGAYLKQGAHLPIDWLPYSAEAVGQARRLGRPILLVIGAPWSRLARGIDLGAFSDPDVDSYLARNYVCMRVDGDSRPEWLNAMLPVSRLQARFQVGFQAWVLDPKGNLLEFFGRTGSDDDVDSQAFLTALIEARKRYDAFADGVVGEAVSVTTQKMEVESLRAKRGALVPPFADYTDAMAQGISPEYGGFPFRGIRRLAPNAWRYLMAVGRMKDATTSLDPILLSPMTDIVDGGFYRLSRGDTYDTVEFDKLAVENAEMAATLANAASLTGDPLYRQLAITTFDYVVEGLRAHAGDASCRVGDEDRADRSERSSFSPARLRELLSDDRGWAEDHLGLRAGEHPQMIPFYSTRAIALEKDGPLPRILDTLRRAPRAPQELIVAHQLDVEGLVNARLVETARLLKDPERMARASLRCETLGAYRRPNSVLRELVVHPLPPLLTSYLAYSDAMLQYYFATGRISAFEDGLAILLEARLRFGTKTPGLYLMATPDPKAPAVPDIAVPEIADNTRESATAQAIRLFENYGRLLAQRELGQELQRAAYDAVSLFSDVAPAGGANAGGYFAAAASVQDDAFAVAVGPNAVAIANTLAPRLPNRLVAPALGEVRRDLQTRPPGIYVVRGTAVTGPLSSDQAVKALAATLDLGVSD